MAHTSIDIQTGGTAWALAACSFACLVVLCVTCLLLARMDNGPSLLTAFAEVIKSVRRQPREVLRTKHQREEPES